MHLQKEFDGVLLYSDTDSAYAVISNKIIEQKQLRNGFSFMCTFGIKTEQKDYVNANTFVAIGPKNYSYYNSFTGRAHTVVKGCTLSREETLIMNEYENLTKEQQSKF